MSAHAPVHLEQIADLDPDASGYFTLFAALRERREGKTKDGRPYFDLVLADRSGTVPCKVWDDAPRALEGARQLQRGAVVKVLFEPGRYRGALQLKVLRIRGVEAGDAEAGYDPAQIEGEGWARVSDLACRVLVFDIETVPATDLRRVPPPIAQAVTKHADRTEADEEKVMSLSPWFGKVVSIALGEGDPAAAAEAVGAPDAKAAEEAGEDPEVSVLVVPPEGRGGDAFPPWIRPMSEPELLTAFWQLAARAEVVVSYNGRGFDVPFLVARSLIHGIEVRVDLMGPGLRPHLDLYPVLASGGGRYNARATGPSSLDVVCWSLGITSPKDEMDGSMVAPTYARGDIETIARYNAGDVRATAAVYRHVEAHLLRFLDTW